MRCSFEFARFILYNGLKHISRFLKYHWSRQITQVRICYRQLYWRYLLCARIRYWIEYLSWTYRNVMIANLALGRLNRRLETSYQQLTNHACIIQRCKASAASTRSSSTQSSNHLAVEDVEWSNAKPFEEMPGLRSVPILGTSWVMLPVVGNVCSTTCYCAY